MQLPNNQFKKGERLKSRKLIQSLFVNGQSKSFYPIRIVWLQTELNSSYPIQTTFSVSKKKFPKAVDRNRIKRQMREAYRLQKQSLCNDLTNNDQQIALMFIFLAKEFHPYQTISKSLALSLKYLHKNLIEQTNA